MINFTGTYLSPVNVQKNSGRNYYNSNVSVVRLSPKEINDLKFLDNTTKMWHNEAHEEPMVSKIYRSAYICAQKDYEYEDSVEFFAITSQEDNFDSLTAPHTEILFTKVSFLNSAIDNLSIFLI